MKKDDDIPSKNGIRAIIILGLILVAYPCSLLYEIDYSYIDNYVAIERPIVVKKTYPTSSEAIIRSVFPAHLEEKALEVAFCESSLNGKAHGDKNLTSIDPNNGDVIGDSIGLFQIRTGGVNPNGTVWNRARANGMSTDQFRSWMFDKRENTKYALTIYNRYGWGMWTCSGEK